MMSTTADQTLTPKINAPFLVSDRVTGLAGSGIRRVFNIANERLSVGKEVFQLVIGSPDMPTPEKVVQGVIESVQNPARQQYSPNAGYPELQKKLADHIRKTHGLEFKPGQIMITPGAMTALAAAMAAVAPGKTVLLPDPGYLNYIMQCRVLGLEFDFYQLNPDNGFEPDPEQIEGMIDTANGQIGGLLINSPSNPTGAVFASETIKAITEIAAKYHIPIISDEPYDALILDDGLKHTSPAHFAPDQTLLISAFSKTFSMTGLRVGYIVIPEHSESIHKVAEALWSGAPTICQMGVLNGLDDAADIAEGMRVTYRDRRNKVLAVLDQNNVPYIRLQGAFYAMVDISQTGMDSDAFAVDLIEQTGVAVAPGATFGPSGDRFVRVAFCREEAELVEGSKRLCEFLKQRL